jgi:hypothetical protein
VQIDKLDINQTVPEKSYPVQKLRENNVEGIDIMQISGHKNVAFINNYSTLSEEEKLIPILWTLHRFQWKIGIYFYKNKIKLSYIN